MRTYSGSWYDRRASRRANGVYSGTRADWVLAYRVARVRRNAGLKPDEKAPSIQWKAELIVHYERDAREPLRTTPAQNRALKRMIDEIMAEIEAEEAAS